MNKKKLEIFKLLLSCQLSFVCFGSTASKVHVNLQAALTFNFGLASERGRHVLAGLTIFPLGIEMLDQFVLLKRHLAMILYHNYEFMNGTNSCGKAEKMSMMNSKIGHARTSITKIATCFHRRTNTF